MYYKKNKNTLFLNKTFYTIKGLAKSEKLPILQCLKGVDMKNWRIRMFCALLFGLFCISVHAQQKITISLSNPLEIGKADLLFGDVTAICEDDPGNFYVVDMLEPRIYKFSTDGKRLLAFGRRGQGPGDFQRPNRISLTPKGELAIADEMYAISFLTLDGKFIKRIHLNQALAPGYIGENCFYAWRWHQDETQQIFLDINSQISKTHGTIPLNQFSVSAPDQSGRQVMFSYSQDVYAPSFIFSNNGYHSAIAVNNVYEIQIVDGNGKTVCTLHRRISPERLSRKEIRYFSGDIQELGKKRGWPPKVIKELQSKIPEKKSFFDRVLITTSQIFVYRIREDITTENSVIPVDIFSLDGQFMGTARMKEGPIFMSDKRMYFAKSDTEGNVYLVVKDYEVKQ